jgi:hypothetical protein
MHPSIHALALVCAGVALSACVTTGDVDRDLKSTWIGASSDTFFTRYGPPKSTFKLNNGDLIYTWRGGEDVRHIPAQVGVIRDDPFMWPGPGPYDRMRPWGRMWIDDPAVVMISPARDEELYCEAQLTVDRKHIIRSIRASGDTSGKGFSLSRCAEVFNVKNR